jgi:hypothetical protein
MNKNDYLDIEAQEGSDNEAHDDVIKKLNDESEEDNEETKDEDVEDLVNKYSQNNKDIKKVIERYKEDVEQKDKEIVKEIINQGARAKKRKFSEIRSELKFDEDNLPIQNRIRRERKEVTTKDFEKKIFNLSKYKKALCDNAEEAGEEVNEILENYEQDVKKKISEQSTDFHRKFKERIKENEKNMEKVINLNQTYVPVRRAVVNHNSFLAAIDGKYEVGKTVTSTFQTNVHSVFRNRNNTVLRNTENKAHVSGIFGGEGYYEPGKIVKLNKN